MPTRHRADALATRMALRDNRRLHFGRPIPTLASAREHLEALRAPVHRIITRDYHSSSALPPNQGAKTRRCAASPQGGPRTALTARDRAGQVNGRNHRPTRCNERPPSDFSQSLHERKSDARSKEAKDKGAHARRSRGCSVVELCNQKRPHSPLGYETPGAFTA